MMRVRHAQVHLLGLPLSDTRAFLAELRRHPGRWLTRTSKGVPNFFLIFCFGSVRFHFGWAAEWSTEWSPKWAAEWGEMGGGGAKMNGEAGEPTIGRTS